MIVEFLSLENFSRVESHKALYSSSTVCCTQHAVYLLCLLVKVVNTRKRENGVGKNNCLLKPFISPFRCVISADCERAINYLFVSKGQIVP